MIPPVRCPQAARRKTAAVPTDRAAPLSVGRSACSTTCWRSAVARIEELAGSRAREAAAEVAMMPAGPHAILDQIKEAVQRRATTLLEQLHKIGEVTPLETVEG
jgi:hypothetical protein